MIKIPNPFDETPLFINELGVKWWKDEHTTRYARNPDRWGTTIEATCYYIETTNGYRSRVLVSDEGCIIEEDQNLESLACKIDVRKLLHREL